MYDLVVLGLAVVTLLFALKSWFRPKPLQPGAVTWDCLAGLVEHQRCSIESNLRSGKVKALSVQDADDVPMLFIYYRHYSAWEGRIISTDVRNASAPRVGADRIVRFTVKGEEMKLYPQANLPMRLWPSVAWFRYLVSRAKRVDAAEAGSQQSSL